MENNMKILAAETKIVILTTVTIFAAIAIFAAGFISGFYSNDKLDAEVASRLDDKKVLQQAGYIQEPYFVDEPVKEWAEK